MGKIPAILTAVAAVGGTAASIVQAQKKPPGPSRAQLAAAESQRRKAVKQEAESRAGIAATKRLRGAGSPLSFFGSRTAGRSETFGG